MSSKNYGWNLNLGFLLLTTHTLSLSSLLCCGSLLLYHSTLKSPTPHTKNNLERTQVHQIQVGSCLFLMLFLYLKLTQQAKTKLSSFKSSQTKYLNIKPKKKKKKKEFTWGICQTLGLFSLEAAKICGSKNKK